MIKPIDNIKQAHKFASVQLGVVGATLAGAAVAFPDAALQVWDALPIEVKALIPPQYLPAVGIVVSVLGVLSRLIKQPKLSQG